MVGPHSGRTVASKGAEEMALPVSSHGDMPLHRLRRTWQDGDLVQAAKAVPTTRP